MKRTIEVICVTYATLGYVVTQAFGKVLDAHQWLGALLISTMILSVSVVFFLEGAFPFRSMIQTDKTIALSYKVSILCLTLATFQVPVWVLFAGLPPTSTLAIAASIFTGLAIFGPATPWIVLTRRELIRRNQKKNG